jgi:peptidoglycan hydrolase-like protein with peptidoglycan-binding domain
MVLGIATEYQTGSSGNGVKQIQAALAFAGYLQTAPDGLYGPLTKQAVQRFQSDKGLVIDGIVGEKTWAALFGGGTVTPTMPPALIPLPKSSTTPTMIVLPAGATAQLIAGLSPIQIILGGLGILVVTTMTMRKSGKGRKRRKR